MRWIELADVKHRYIYTGKAYVQSETIVMIPLERARMDFFFLDWVGESKSNENQTVCRVTMSVIFIFVFILPFGSGYSFTTLIQLSCCCCCWLYFIHCFDRNVALVAHRDHHGTHCILYSVHPQPISLLFYFSLRPYTSRISSQVFFLFFVVHCCCWAAIATESVNFSLFFFLQFIHFYRSPLRRSFFQ